MTTDVNSFDPLTLPRDLVRVVFPVNGTMSSPTLSALPGMTGRWNAASAPGTPVTVTYSFSDTAPGYSPSPASEPNSYTAYTPEEIANVEAVLAAYHAVCGLTFQFQPDPDLAQMVYRKAELTAASGVGFYPPLSGLAVSAGDVYLDTQNAGQAYIAFHETGHALGLAHAYDTNKPIPEDYGFVGSRLLSVVDQHALPRPFYVHDLGNGQYSIDSLFHPVTPMPLDILALQMLYGQNTSTNAGDTVYSYPVNPNFYQTIWDGGGIDTIDCSNQVNPNLISLVGGSYSSIGLRDPLAGWPQWVINWATSSHAIDSYNDGRDKLAIAFDAVIENATGGSAGDRLLGNDAANLLRGLAGNDTLAGANGNDQLEGGDGDDSLAGGNGDDVLRGDAGNDALDGGGGSDTARYANARNGYTITGNDVAATVSGSEGTDVLANIEQLQFSDGLVALAAPPPAGAMHIRTDLNGNAKSDLLIRHDNGTIEYRLMDGVNLAGYKDDPIPTYWKIVNADSDFNGDGKSDVVLRHDNGMIEYRLMDGTNLVGYKDDPIPTYWKIVNADSDFNGDGKSDVVLRHDNGTIEYRLMDGTNLIGYKDDPIPSYWRIVSTDSDFNGDGKSDVVLRHDNGTIEYRLMDGTNLIGYKDDPIPSYWHIVSTKSDFNGDGKSDVVLRHDNGTIEYRLMDGTNFIGYKDDPIPTYWHIVSTDSDFNGDGKSDVVLRHDNGTIEYRLMNGVNLSSYKDDPIPTYWKISSTDNDFNGDGKSDVVLRHDNGTIETRLMDGVNLLAYKDDPIPTYWQISVDAEWPVV